MKYSTKNEHKARTILVILLAVIIAAGIAVKICSAEEPAWDVCYDMANKNIEWTWAGR